MKHVFIDVSYGPLAVYIGLSRLGTCCGDRASRPWTKYQSCAQESSSSGVNRSHKPQYGTASLQARALRHTHLWIRSRVLDWLGFYLAACGHSDTAPTPLRVEASYVSHSHWLSTTHGGSHARASVCGVPGQTRVVCRVPRPQTARLRHSRGSRSLSIRCGRHGILAGTYDFGARLATVMP